MKNLSFLYFATFIMRAAAFAGVAVMQHVIFRGNSHPIWAGVLFAIFPLAEIASVGYFGTLCDRIGRKKVLVFAHLISGVAVFFFIPSISPAVPGELSPFLVAISFALFGAGAAAKVSSTLTMVNDLGNVRNRAQLMAVFDLVTLGGFAGGFGIGFLGLTAFHWDPSLILLAGGVGVLASLFLIIFFVRDTRFIPEARFRTRDLLRSVLRDRDVLKLLPVYIPVMALYGYVVAFTDRLLVGRDVEPLRPGALLVVVFALVLPLVVSMLVTSRYSDKARLRRPFMAVGLFCFGGLAIVLNMVTRPGGGIGEQGLLMLSSRWPILAILAAGAGAFPPAALAYLGDIVKKAVSGTTFGLYSIIFGSGLIIGPILGGALTAALGATAFIVTALSLIGISAVSVIFIREPSRTMAGAGGLPAAGADPPRDAP